jgi:hypothetical protein
VNPRTFLSAAILTVLLTIVVVVLYVLLRAFYGWAL